MSNRRPKTERPVRAAVHRTRRFCLALLLASSLTAGVMRAATEHVGQVTFNDLPVPGAAVTASQGDRTVATVTNQDGLYRFADLADGTWSMRVTMVGFAPSTRDVLIAPDTPPAVWTLTLVPFEEIAKIAQTMLPPVMGPSPAPGQAPGGFQRTDVQAAARINPAPPMPAPDEPPADPAGAADGLLINGSVNNGAVSPFAQPAAFGNARRNTRSLYNGGLGLLAGNSAWDARPFSFTGLPATRPDYNDLHVMSTFGGPLKLPGVMQRRPQLFFGYQRTRDNVATMQSALVPTLAERLGDFSQHATAITDPRTGQPFAGSQIPADRLSPQAAALLRLYPEPNLDAGGRFNYQGPVLTVTRQDSFQTRVTQTIDNRNQLAGTAAYQRTRTDSRSLFGFDDRTKLSAIDSTVTWSRRFSPFFTMRPRYQFTQSTTEAVPFFANRNNVSGEAGILGNDQAPENWGPPALVFASGVENLTSNRPQFTRTRTHTAAFEAQLSRGRHNLTFGGDVRRHDIDIRAQQDPRGRFSFTGETTGSDVADFLLGIPRTTSIAFGNADKFFDALSYDAYITDDVRLSPSFTVNLGVRWEYEAPITEALGRLVNLDITDGFRAAAPVLASDPTGALTGRPYATSLMNPDKRGIQPRLAMAWRPVPGSSLIVRAGYGIYRNTNVYQSIATLLAQQPPLSRSFSVENDADDPLTLADAFTATVPMTTQNTFAVDPALRVGYAQNWQASIQRDLPASLTVTATYLGTKGSHLLQELLPNTYPAGADHPCPTCPAGFVYLTSGGSSSRHAGQLQLRRRLRNGLTWTTQYTLARAEDDATAFTGASLSGTAIAQNWLDLDAEWGPSSFDQRHQVTASLQYTTGVGVAGGALLTGIKGALIKGWTVTTQMTTGSGLPVTPVYLGQVAGTGVIGPLRADLTGASPGDVPDGYYLNPAAFTLPAAGTFGRAGRHSARGPAQFSLDAGITRTFPWGNRINLDWRLDATNILNRVTYSAINTIVGSPQFGLPTSANAMRKIQTSLRMRF